MSGSYREWEPRSELRGLVACVWERTVESADAAPSRVLPDGCVDLVFRSDGNLVVAGPDLGPVLHDVSAARTITGLRFRPGAAGAGLGLPASELRDQRVALADVWGAAGAELAERLGDAPDRSGRFALLQTIALRRLGGSSETASETLA